jgi:hypothetical protein
MCPTTHLDTRIKAPSTSKTAQLLIIVYHHKTLRFSERAVCSRHTWIIWLSTMDLVSNTVWKQKWYAVKTLANHISLPRFYSSPSVYRALAIMIRKSSKLFSTNKRSKILSDTLPVFDLHSKHSLSTCCPWGMISLFKAPPWVPYDTELCSLPAVEGRTCSQAGCLPGYSFWDRVVFRVMPICSWPPYKQKSIWSSSLSIHLYLAWIKREDINSSSQVQDYENKVFQGLKQELPDDTCL